MVLAATSFLPAAKSHVGFFPLVPISRSSSEKNREKVEASRIIDHKHVEEAKSLCMSPLLDKTGELISIQVERARRSFEEKPTI